MRHRDDDLEPFREEPVVKALGAPGDSAELAGYPEAVAAYGGGAPPPPLPPKRSGGRGALLVVLGIVVLLVAGVAGAAYGNYLPDKWQQKLHDQISSIPAPATPAPVAVPTPTPISTPTQVATPTYTPSHNSGSGSPTPTGAASSAAPSSKPSKAPSATPTSTAAPVPVDGKRLQIRVTPGTRVSYGTKLTVGGKLTDPDGNVLANRRVVLIQKVAGESSRVGSGRTGANGQVTISGPTAQRNVTLSLQSGGLSSPDQQVVVIPLLHVEVPPTAAGATSTTVKVTVMGGRPGDTVVIRGPGTNDTHRGTLNSSGSTLITVPVSQTQTLHYRAEVSATDAHGAHSLAFYVRASGG